MRRLKLLFRLFLAVAGAVFLFLATSRFSIPATGGVSDKINHVAAFFVLALMVDFSWPETGLNARKILSLLGYGLFIEIVQYFLPYRTFSLHDLGADGIGILLYRITVPLLRTLALFRNRREEDAD